MNCDVQYLYDTLDIRISCLKGPSQAKEKQRMDETFLSYLEFYYPEVTGHKCYEKFKDTILSGKTAKYFGLKSKGLFYNWTHGTSGKTGEYSFLGTILGVTYSDKKQLSHNVLFLSQYIEERKRFTSTDEKRFYRYLNLPAITFLSATVDWCVMGVCYDEHFNESLKVADLNLQSSEVRLDDFKSYQTFLETSVIKRTGRRNAELLARLDMGDVNYLKAIIRKTASGYQRLNKDAQLITDLELNFHIKSIFSFIAFTEIERELILPESELVEGIKQFMRLHYQTITKELFSESFDLEHRQNRLQDMRIVAFLRKAELFSEDELEKVSAKLTHFIKTFRSCYGIKGNQTSFTLLFGQEIYASYIQSIQSSLKDQLQRALELMTGQKVDLNDRQAISLMVEGQVTEMAGHFGIEPDILLQWLPKSTDSLEIHLSKAGHFASLLHNLKDVCYALTDLIFSPATTPFEMSEEQAKHTRSHAIEILDILYQKPFSLEKLLKKVQQFEFRELQFELDEELIQKFDHLHQRLPIVDCMTEISSGRLHDETFCDELKELIWTLLKSFSTITIKGDQISNQIGRDEFEVIFQNVITFTRELVVTENFLIRNFPKEFRAGLGKIYPDLLTLTIDLVNEEKKVA